MLWPRTTLLSIKLWNIWIYLIWSHSNRFQPWFQASLPADRPAAGRTPDRQPPQDPPALPRAQGQGERGRRPHPQRRHHRRHQDQQEGQRRCWQGSLFKQIGPVQRIRFHAPLQVWPHGLGGDVAGGRPGEADGGDGRAVRGAAQEDKKGAGGGRRGRSLDGNLWHGSFWCCRNEHGLKDSNSCWFHKE